MACSIGDTIINGTGTSHRTWYTFVVSTALRTLYELIRYVGAPPRPTKFPTLACTHAADHARRTRREREGEGCVWIICPAGRQNVQNGADVSLRCDPSSSG